MPRRPAVLLTSPRSIPDSSLFCTLCTLLQKSEAHLLPLQPLPASLQKPRVGRHKRFLTSRQEPPAPVPFRVIFCTSHHQDEAHPLPFQSLPHSFAETPGCHPEPSLPSTVGCRPSTSALPKLFRMNTYKTVSKQRTLTTFRMNTYKKNGGRGAHGA
jgi:hypothetical protein